MLSVLDLLFCNDNDDDMCISYSSFRVLGFAGLCRTASIVTTTVSEKVEKKVAIHEKMFRLATRKQNSIIDLGSKVLNDKDKDHEFRIISNEMMQYRSNERRNF